MNIENKVKDSLQTTETSKTDSYDEETIDIQKQQQQQGEVVNSEADHAKEIVNSKSTLEIGSGSQKTTMDDDGSGQLKSNKEEPNLNEGSSEEKEIELEGIEIPNPQDILSGRGTGINLHPGNVFFRKLIQSHKEQYIKSDPARKRKIIKEVMQKSNTRRYLRHDLDTFRYIEISEEEIRKKVGQALRENAPAIKRRHQDYELSKMMQTQLAWEGGQGQEQEQHRKEKKEIEFNNILRDTMLPAYKPPLRRTQLDLSSSLSGIASASTTTAKLQPQMTFASSNLKMPPPRMNLHNSNPYSFEPGLGTAEPPPSSTPRTVPLATRTHFLLSQISLIQSKQSDLRRKQREIEDEQDELMKYFYQLTTTLATLISSRDNTAINDNSPVRPHGTFGSSIRPQQHQYQHQYHQRQHDQHQQQFSFSQAYPMMNRLFETTTPVSVTSPWTLESATGVAEAAEAAAAATESATTVAEAVAAASAVFSASSNHSKSDDSDGSGYDADANVGANDNFERLSKKRRLSKSKLKDH